MLVPGTLLQERYRIIQLLGQGGMGAVYEALDLRLQTHVALKHLIRDTAFDHAFAREAQILATLRHPAIPLVSDYLVEATGQFLIMQLIPGEDIGTMLARRASPFPLDRVLRWTDQLLGTLEYLHQQNPPVIHRDIKPQNIKLTADDAVVLLDFGLAKGVGALRTRVDTVSSIFGYTPQYAPLEQIRDEGTDARSDLFALAATVYHLLTNTKPIDVLRRASDILAGRSDPLLPITEANSQIPAAIAAVIIQALALNPAQRPASAASMRRALHQASDEHVTAVAVSATRPQSITSAERAPVAASQVPGATTLSRGTVTFLCVDVPADPQPDRSWPFARLDIATLVQQSATAHGGVLVQAQAGEVWAAFVTAPGALAAAVSIQRQCCASPSTTSLPARLALHTGTAEIYDDRYGGHALHRAAHILAAGHAGQIVLSRATHELVRDALPANVLLRDLGEHRLADLTRPEHLFQVTAPDLPDQFPPLATLEQHPNNLPTQPTPLIGRKQELALIKQMLQSGDTRLVTLTGTGGAGKTRLSLQVAADLLPMFADGVFFVSLVPIRTPDLVTSTIAEALGVREAGVQPLIERLKEWLRERHLLLVLDNFEQVVVAAPIVADVLSTAPRLKILVTSREVLRLSGERSFLVPPLALPNPVQHPTAEQLTQYEAVQLFIERAQAVNPNFQVTNANAPAVAEICYRLDGLPLAIELAAARIRLLTPQTLLERLGSRLKLLTSGARDLPARQQTLRRTIDWSHDLLDAAEQQLFRRLAVFVGGRTLEAAEAVCNADADLPIDVLDGLASLLDKSLLYQAEGAGDEPRFMMLETIWEYAVERLAASEECEPVRQRHAAYYLELAERAAPELRGADQLRWLDQFEREHDNLRAALGWATETGETAIGTRIGVALLRFWEVRTHLSEGRRWYDHFLVRQGDLPPELRTRLLNTAGRMAFNQSDYECSSALYAQGLELAQAQSDQAGCAAALSGLGIVARAQGEFAHAVAYFEQALPLWRATQDRLGIAVGLLNQGIALKDQGYYSHSTALLEESLQLYRSLGDTLSVALVLDHLAAAARQQGEYDHATALQEECLALRRTLRDKRGIAASLCDTGNIALDQGQIERAIALYEESLALFRAVGEKWRTAIVLDNLGYAFQHQGDYPRALAFHDQGLQIQRAIGDKHGAAMSLDNIGVLALRQDNLPCAAASFAESLALRDEINDRSGIWSVLEGLAEVAFRLHQAERAARIFGAAEGLRDAIGDSISSANLHGYEHTVAALRAELGAITFAAAWAAGRALPLAQVVADALAQE
jgi:predicted ATPase/class 3 adenylate cyclase